MTNGTKVAMNQTVWLTDCWLLVELWSNKCAKNPHNLDHRNMRTVHLWEQNFKSLKEQSTNTQNTAKATQGNWLKTDFYKLVKYQETQGINGCHNACQIGLQAFLQSSIAITIKVLIFNTGIEFQTPGPQGKVKQKSGRVGKVGKVQNRNSQQGQC